MRVKKSKVLGNKNFIRVKPKTVESNDSSQEEGGDSR